MRQRPLDRFVRVTRAISQPLRLRRRRPRGFGVLVVCQMVFVRYALDQTTIWQTDFVTYSLVAATFIGSPYVLTCAVT